MSKVSTITIHVNLDCTNFKFYWFRGFLFLTAIQKVNPPNVIFIVAHSLISIHDPLKRIQGLMVKLLNFYAKKKNLYKTFQDSQGLFKHLAKVPSLSIQCTRQINCEIWEWTILTSSLLVSTKSIHFQLS